MKNNPRNLKKDIMLLSRSQYNRHVKTRIYDSNVSNDIVDKIAIPHYNKGTLKRSKIPQNIVFSIFLISFTLTFFFIFNFSLVSFFSFSLISLLFVPLYLLFDKGMEKAYNDGKLTVECYLANFFNRNDLLLVHWYCNDDFNLWAEAVVDAEYYGSEKAKEYAKEILNIAKLRKNKAEKDTQDNFKNKWSENIEYAKTKHAVEQELL